MAIAWNYAARTDVGLVRSRNEDSGYAGPHFIAIADGMGGHAGGNVASSLVISRLARLDGDSHGCDNALEMLATAVAEANSDINQAIDFDPSLHGMGTTLTGLMRCGSDNLVLVHIGDSRAFLLRDDVFSQITIDHSFVQSLVDAGRISPEEAESHPQRSLITRVLTGAIADEPDLSVRKARIGDRYLICSDGLSDYVGRSTIEEVIRAAESPTEGLRRLVDLALKAGAPDNVTGIIADVTDTRQNSPHHPVVVGAAAERRREDTATAALSPAAKAAALHQQVTGTADTGEPDPDPVDADDDARLRRTHRSGLLVTLVVLSTFVVGLFGAYQWSQTQHFLAESNGKVAVYSGIPQSLGSISLASLERTVDDITVADLPDYYRIRLQHTIPAGDETDIENQIEVLRVQQAECVSRRAAGAPCGSGDSTTTPTTTPIDIPNQNGSTTAPANASAAPVAQGLSTTTQTPTPHEEGMR